MSFTAKDVLWACRTALLDANNTRWTLEELRVYLNAGLKEIAFHKPTAVSENTVIDLDEGTYQELADGSQLLRVVRNITAEGPPRVAGKNITPIDRSILDSQVPGWHQTSVVPFSATVTHVMTDEMNPRVFYVYPGNTGLGKIEAIISTVPAPVAAPADPLDIDQYSASIDLPDLYENVLRDYVLYRAFQKDVDVPGAAQRSTMHQQNWMSALGMRQQVEMLANINTDTK